MLAHDIIIRPIITEKSMGMAEEKKYTFVVARTANKIEIKKAAEQVFGVQVEKVYTMNYRGKEKRMGRNVGRTAAYKKAIIQLKDTSKDIEFFGV